MTRGELEELAWQLRKFAGGFWPASLDGRLLVEQVEALAENVESILRRGRL